MKEFFSPAELAALKLPDMPVRREDIAHKATAEGWRDPNREWSPQKSDGLWRRVGNGYEYRYDVLPVRAKRKLMLMQRREEARSVKAQKKDGLALSALWEWFDALPAARQAKARERLAALHAVEDLVMAGRRRDIAMTHVAAELKVSLRTLYYWAEMVAGKKRADWLPHLMPRNGGRTVTADYSEEAWEFFRDNYLTQSERSAAYVYRDLVAIAKVQDWTVPSLRTLERRLDKIDPARRVYLRKGEEALKRLLPAQERDKTALHALEAVNADGHKLDLFVRWLDGKVHRPVLIAFQDIYSGKILSWRVSLSESWDIVRLAFADMVETYGVPDHVLLDNGRAFASKKLTGGTPNRFRFKVKPEEPEGVITALGCKIHWATPYHGQSKPIERAWRDLAHTISRDVRFEGAFTGNSIANKPENHGTHAVDYELFLKVVSERILEHNAREGRRSKVCGGRLSFDQAFSASYATSLITKPSEQALRKLLLSSELVTARKPSGEVEFCGNRYWGQFLLGEIGRKVVLRFDPEALHQPVHIYSPTGAYLGSADCIAKDGFFDTSAAQAKARIKAEFTRATRLAALAAQKLSLTEQAALLPAPAAPEPLTPRVQRPIIVKGANALKAIETEVVEEGEDAFMDAFKRSASRFRVVRNEDGAGD